MNIYTVLIMEDYNVGIDEIKNFLSEEEAQSYIEDVEDELPFVDTDIYESEVKFDSSNEDGNKTKPIYTVVIDNGFYIVDVKSFLSSEKAQKYREEMEKKDPYYNIETYNSKIKLK